MKIRELFKIVTNPIGRLVERESRHRHMGDLVAMRRGQAESRLFLARINKLKRLAQSGDRERFDELFRRLGVERFPQFEDSDVDAIYERLGRQP